MPASATTKTFRFPAELISALETWRDKVEAAEGVRPSWQAAVIRLLWQALRGGQMEKLSREEMLFSAAADFAADVAETLESAAEYDERLDAWEREARGEDTGFPWHGVAGNSSLGRLDLSALPTAEKIFFLGAASASLRKMRPR